VREARKLGHSRVVAVVTPIGDPRRSGFIIPATTMRCARSGLFTSKISESIAEGCAAHERQADRRHDSGTEQAQAREAQNAEDAASALRDPRPGSRRASDLADIGEDISMEEVLGPGTHKKPVATKKPRPTFQKVESQTV